jgi:hypothetical protein
MSSPNELLRVDPTELRLTADQIDGHAADFLRDHQIAHWRASSCQTSLGSGLASAALPGMLAAWEEDGTRFGKHFVTHAQGHREAASSYVATDANGASGIDDVGSAL